MIDERIQTNHGMVLLDGCPNRGRVENPLLCVFEIVFYEIWMYGVLEKIAID